MTRFLITAAISLFFALASFGQGQTTVTSSNGYSVKIVISSVVLNKYPYPGNPTGGCNYNITLTYNITFSGPNQPGSMWTLQGYVRCNQSTFFDLPNNGGAGSVTSAMASYTGNPATLTLSSICKYIDIEILGPGVPYKIVTIPIGGGVLPIELLSFEAQQQGQQVVLNWSTATERNNDFFTIEKTTDGINYEQVAHIKGAGNSASKREYTFTDANPSAGTSYYRLTQTDLNGDTETFEPVSVEVKLNGILTNVFPNPARDSRINISISQADAPVTVNLFNVYGQMVSSQTLDASSASLTQALELPQTGNTFFVEVIQNGGLVARHQVMAIR